MNTKVTSLVERLNGALTSVKEIEFAKDPGEGKTLLVSALRVATTSFGKVADRMDTLSILKALHEEAKDIKKKEFKEIEEFTKALSDFRDQAVSAIENTITELQDLPEDVGVKEDGSVDNGRTTFQLQVHPIDKPDEISILQTSDISKGYLASETFKAYLAALQAGDKPSYANFLRDYFRKELGLTWIESSAAAENNFYKVYRLTRPTVHRAIKKVLNPAPPVETPVATGEFVPPVVETPEVEAPSEEVDPEAVTA